MTSKEENMLEKCARALWEAPPYGDERISWDEMRARIARDPEFAEFAAGTVEDQVAAARAVIEALMEPTPEMRKAGLAILTSEYEETGELALPYDIFRAMLRSILQSKEEGEGR